MSASETLDAVCDVELRASSPGRVKRVWAMRVDVEAVIEKLEGDGPGLRSVELLLECLGLDAAHQVLVAPAPRAVASEHVTIGTGGGGLCM